jgi:hypothetical protein
MLSYWILLAAPIISGLAPYKLHGAAARVGVWLAAIGLVAFIGLRFVVGCDWYNYIAALYDLNYTNPIEAMQVAQDPGYGLLEWLSLNIGTNIYGVNFVCGLIFTWGLFAFCSRQPLPWLTVVVAVPMLIIVVSMGFTRQGAAIGFLMLALSAFEDKSLRRFLIYVALATTFHKTAVIMAPLAIFIDPKRVVGPLVIGGAVTGVLVIAFVSAKLDSLTHNYIGNAEWEGEGAAAIYRLGLNLAAAVAFFLFNKRWRQRYDDARLYFILSCAAAVAFPFTFIEPVAADRMGLYLLPYQAAVIGRLPDLFDRKRVGIPITIAAVIGSAALMTVWFLFANNSWCWRPYNNLLFFW